MAGLKAYKEKVITIPDAVAMVKSNQTIGLAIAASEPIGLLTELANQKDRLQNVTLWTCLPMRAYDIFRLPEMEGHFYNENWFYGSPDREAHPQGRVSYTPNNLHRAATDKLHASNNHLNVFWGTATPPDKRGYLSLSLGIVVEKELIEAADLVVLEINENLPWTYGDTQIHISEIDFLVEHTIPLVELQAGKPSEAEQQIGGYTGSLIEDGATIQLGIGGIPSAISPYLMDRKDLGVHTELLVDSFVDLYEAGIITNRKKNIHPGKMIGTFALGSKKLYDFLDHNVGVEIYKGCYVNKPTVIARNPKMVSVNTAIQVDILGQVCSQSIGTRHFSGTGGQLDTHRGAQMSEGGRGIIALRATAKNGTISTIVPTLAPGSGVTVPSQDVDTIITEYGIAELRGRCVRDRLEALVKIAHPNFRDWIREEAHSLGIVPDKRFFKAGEK